MNLTYKKIYLKSCHIPPPLFNVNFLPDFKQPTDYHMTEFSSGRNKLQPLVGCLYEPLEHIGLSMASTHCF